MLNQKKFTVASLFAGIGGFCTAFELENFQVLWANELDSNATKTYKLNHPEVQLFGKSIEQVSVIHDFLPQVDVLTAGFPCQPYSIAGNKLGLKDPRGKIFFEIIRLLKEFGSRRPKILLFENVPGLLFHDRGASFSLIANAIQSAGYWFVPPDCHAVLNTYKVTGIPQSRERLFMVALSWDFFEDQSFEFPTFLNKIADPVKNYLDIDQPADQDLYFDKEKRWGKLFEESMSNGKAESVYQLRRYYVRENKNDIVPTLTANMGEGGHNVPVIKDSWGIRKLTTIECLRLQGFDPSKFTFPDSVARGQRYKQIGNAVTVPLVQVLARECRRLLEKEN